jgi:dienelactone hydrolase
MLNMRPLEWLIVTTSLLAIFCFLQPQPPVSILWLGVAAALLVLLHALLEGIHWQMAPAYLAAPLTLFAGAMGLTSPMLRLSCAIMAGVLVAASLLLSWVLPMFKLPVPTGKFPVGTRTLYLTDLNRAETHEGARPGNREVVVQLWYPAVTAKWRRAVYRRKRETTLRSSYQAVLKTRSLQDAPTAAGRFPVIVYNSGWWSFRNRSTFITQDLASHGFVVVSLSHPYNSSMVELVDGSVANPDYSLDLGFSFARYIPIQERFAMADEELAIQTADCRFVLDELEKLDRTPGHPLESRLCMDRVGACGHSFGGAVSVECAREDARVRAALELDGVLHGAAASHGLDKPVLLIDSPWMISPGEHTKIWAPKTLDNARVAETSRLWNMIAESKARLLERCGGVQVIIHGLGHFAFTDQIFMSPLRRLSGAGSVAPKRLAHILTTYVLAFFQQTLLDQPSTLFSRDAKDYPEVTVREWRPCVKGAEG